MSKPRFAIQSLTVILIIAAFVIIQTPALLAQAIPVDPAPQPVQAAPLSAQELDSLVAPIALYPDPLLSQILVAATYPLEIVQAGQWMQQNPGLTGAALQEAARQQNWDPSVQALLVFPDVIRLLSSNVQWTTELGNAFLAQQADVMDAVQQMRVQAQNAGTLTSTPQMTVASQPVAGAPPAVVIQPANPQVLYVPIYDPLVVWGPAVYPYPALWYPPVYIGRRVLSFGPGIWITASFGGWGGWGGWGWYPNWYGRSVYLNTGFFYRYGYRRPLLSVAGAGPSLWVHDPIHRAGVPYAYRQTAMAYASRPAPVSRPMTMPRSSQYAPARASTYNRPMPAPSAAVPQRSFVQNNYSARSYAPQHSYAPQPARAPASRGFESRGGGSSHSSHSSSRHR